MFFTQREGTERWDRNAAAWRTRGAANDPHRKYLLDDVIVGLVGDLHGKRVLDAGCGEGYLCRKLTRLGVRVTGVELSQEMLAFARADEEGERLGITYYQGNIASMPFLRDRQFDLVVTNIVLDDCEDYQGAFREFARVLKPGGTYLHVGMHPCFSTPGCGWVKDDQGNKLYFKVNDYLAEGSTGLIRWPQDAMEPTVNFYRTLSMYFNALVDSGFRVERIIEPRPTEEAVQQAPAIADILRIPHFIAMVCRLPARLAA